MLPVHISGYVTADGRLIFTPPAGLPEGEVEIIIQAAEDEQFTDEEIADLLNFTPRPGAEVVADGLVGGWEHKGIDDPVAFVNQIRLEAEGT
jgi:hypothetical protein